MARRSLTGDVSNNTTTINAGVCPDPAIFGYFDYYSDLNNNLDFTEFNDLFTFWADFGYVIPDTNWPNRSEKLSWLFDEIDINDNGLISYDEFSDWVLVIGQ